MSTSTSEPTSSSSAMSWTAFAVAGGSACVLAVADAVWRGVPSSDGSGLSLLFIVGWVLLAWAAVLGVGALARLVWTAAQGARPKVLEIALLTATILLVGGILLAQPLAGSGGADAVDAVGATTVLRR